MKYKTASEAIEAAGEFSYLVMTEAGARLVIEFLYDRGLHIFTVPEEREDGSQVLFIGAPM